MLKNCTSIALTLFVSLIVFACSSPKQSPPRISESGLKMEFLHSISNEDIPLENDYYFSSIGEIIIDSLGNILIVDSDNQTIVSFDKNGSFNFKFGRNGSGPGEFGLVIAVAALKDQSYIAYDLGLKKVVRFSHKGQFLSEHLVSKEVEIRGKAQWLDDERIIYSNVPIFEHDPEVPLIKMFSTKTYSIEKEFLPMIYLSTADELSLPLLANSSKYLAILDDSKLLYAIGHYYGHLHKINFGVEPISFEKVTGYKTIEKTYIATLSRSEATLKKLGTLAATFAGDVYHHSISYSLGLEKQADGTIYHLSSYKPEPGINPYHLILEEFSADGDLQRWGKISDPSFLGNPKSTVLAIDNNGRIYLEDGANNAINVLQLHWME